MEATVATRNPETFEERLMREHRERRARFYQPPKKPEQPAPAIAILICEPYGEPVQIITKPIMEAAARNVFDARPSILVVQRVCAREYGVSENELLSHRRVKSVVEPRQIAIYLSKVLTRWPYTKIARQFSDRDHTTIMHSVRKIEQRIECDAQFAKKVAALKLKIELECWPAIEVAADQASTYGTP